MSPLHFWVVAAVLCAAVWIVYRNIFERQFMSAREVCLTRWLAVVAVVYMMVRA